MSAVRFFFFALSPRSFLPLLFRALREGARRAGDERVGVGVHGLTRVCGDNRLRQLPRRRRGHRVGPDDVQYGVFGQCEVRFWCFLFFWVECGGSADALCFFFFSFFYICDERPNELHVLPPHRV